MFFIQSTGTFAFESVTLNHQANSLYYPADLYEHFLGRRPNRTGKGYIAYSCFSLEASILGFSWIQRSDSSQLDVSVLERNENFGQFLIRGTSVPFINSLRRTIISEVPVMAIDDVIVIENTSVMSDEMLAHRLGLVPLTTDLDRYVLPEDCTCQSEFGCSKCRAVLTLEAEPGESAIMVYSGDIVPEDPGVRPTHDRIPLVKLVSGQRIRLETYARLGQGKKHAKWQPVSACSYRYMPEVKIRSRRCNLCGECVKLCPKKILSIEGKRLVVSNPLDCTSCEDCVRACPMDPPAIGIVTDKDSFIFQVESTGALPVDRLVTEAADILTKKTRVFLKQLKEHTS